MQTDIYGQIILSENDICNLYYLNPDRTFSKPILSDTQIDFDVSLDVAAPKIKLYNSPNLTVDSFDTINQNNWYMPDEYKNLDIAKFVLDQCKNDIELQRAGSELLLFQERNLFPLLQYLKYLVDTMRKNNIVWGVGRGSSVASFVLYLIGIHKINSIYFDLSIDEFLK